MTAQAHHLVHTALSFGCSLRWVPFKKRGWGEGWVIFIVKLGKAQGMLSMLWLYALCYRRDSFSIEIKTTEWHETRDRGPHGT